MDISQLHFHSYGVAAENKPLGSKELNVTPVELLMFLDGEITNNLVDIEDSGVDHKGQAYTAKVQSDLTLTCTWLPLGSNRSTAPDIRRGERIIILRFADADKYYWVPDGRDERLRRLETAVWRFSDTSDESQMEITDDNSYQFAVSTHEGHITLKTAKSNKEPFQYTVQVNTKDGIVVIADDVGNYFELNSRDTCITLENVEKSRLVLDKTHAFLETVDTINMKTKTMNVEAQTINTQATDIITNTTTESTTAKTITIDTTSMSTNATTYSITSSTITLTGVVGIAGAVSMAPGAGGGGVSIQGNVNTTGTLTNNGVNVSSTHVHPKGPSSNPNTLTPL